MVVELHLPGDFMADWKTILKTKVVAPAALAATTLLPGCKNEYYDDEAAKLTARLEQCDTLEEKAELLASESERAIKDVIHDFAKRNDKAANSAEKLKRDDSHFMALKEIRDHAIVYHRTESAVLFRPLNNKLDGLFKKINDPKNGDRYLATLVYPGEEDRLTGDDIKFLRQDANIAIHSLQFGIERDHHR
jgi:hypothetical protein